MEHHLQAIAVGIAEDVLVEAHHLLLVATEEVHFDALHANALHPFHFPFTGNGCVHAVTRTLRCIVGEAVAVVPKQQVYTLRLRVFREFGDTVAPDLRVPPVIDEAVLKAHCRGEVDELHLVIVVDAVVLPDEPTPRVATRTVVGAGGVARFHHVVTDGSLHDGLERCAECDGAPGCLAGQGDGSEVGAEAVVLARVRIGDGVAHPRLIVGEMTAAVV